MAELRQDPICGRWVIIATERAARPSDFTLGRGDPKGGFCPFCEGNEDRTPPEIAAVRPGGGPSDSPGWRVRVVPNKFPALSLNGHAVAPGTGHRRRAPGVGTHEVIIESPRHAISPTDMPPSDFEHVIRTYCRRAEALDADSRLAYVLIFKNVGQEAGASIEHAHSQIVGVPVMPRRVAEELERCEQFYRHNGRCLLCDVLAEDLEDGTRVVAQTESFVALSPFAAAFPFTVWLLPRFHAGCLFDMGADQEAELARLFQEAMARVEICLNDPPFNYAVHAAPTAAGGRRDECCHWHIELIPRVTRVAGFEWGTGFYINPVEPESAAAYLRNVTDRQVAERIARQPAGSGDGRAQARHSRS
jgi:UDPglucose--hexose-1-phosphate uridylyltransferase